MESTIEQAHQAFTNRLKQEVKELLWKEDIPLYLHVLREYFVFAPIRMLTIDLFSPKYLRQDFTLFKAAPYMAKITFFDIRVKLGILFRNDISALAIFFYDTHIVRQNALKIMKEAKEKRLSGQQAAEIINKKKREVADRYINASNEFKKLIREAIQKNNEPLMEDLFVRLAWLQIFSYGNNALSPELDALIEKVTGERV